MKKILLFALPLLALLCTSCEKEEKEPETTYYIIAKLVGEGHDQDYRAYTSEQYGAIGDLSNSCSIYYLRRSYGYSFSISTSPSNPWNVSNDADWCHCKYEEMTDNSGTRYLSLSYYLDNNEIDEERSTTITIRNGNASPCEIRITQSGISAVTVSTPGTLTKELADKGLLYATSLKISGELNDKDINTIKNLSKVEMLDLSKVVIDDLPDKMFYENKHIKTVSLPEAITTIHPETFAFSSLEYVYIPANVERIEDGEKIKSKSYTGAFAGTNLKEVKFANNSKLTYIGKYAFAGAGAQYESYETFSRHQIETVLPASVETIGDDVFSENIKWNNSTIINRRDVYSKISFEENSRLKTIGSGDYGRLDASNCTMIESVGSLSGNLKMSIGTEEPPTFSGVNGYSTTLYVPKGCVAAYYEADGWKDFKTIKEIGQE